jgi:SsrA-binding protein
MAKPTVVVPGGKAAKAQKPGKSAKAADKAPEVVEILHNRRLRYDYTVVERWEVGMVLMGSEVKSLRAGDVQWGDAHARLDKHGELWLHGLHIGEYRQASVFGHQPAQPRKLLLHRREIDRMAGAMAGKGLTLKPEGLFFRRGWAKMALCLVKGKTRGDKRQSLMKDATKREVEGEMRRRMKRGS